MCNRLSDISYYSSNIYKKKTQKLWAHSISGTWHCLQDKNKNAIINNFCITSDGSSNTVLSLIFVTDSSSAENTEEVSSCKKSSWEDMPIASDPLGKPSLEHRHKEQAHLRLPEMLNLKPVLGGVEVTTLHLSPCIEISGIGDKTCNLLLTVLN